MRTHISRWLDRIAGILLLFVLSFLWFATRLHGVGWAVLLAGLLTALVCWAYVLLVQRISRRKGKTQSEAARRRAAVYRLTMLPEETALSIAGTALCGAFNLQKSGANGKLVFLTDEKGQLFAAGLCQEPQPVSVNGVHAFHRLRKNTPGILICAGGSTAQAEQYAASLTPPLRLIAADTLPFADCFSVEVSDDSLPKQRMILPLLRDAMQPARSLRYLFLGWMMILFYLFTGAWSALLPGLGLVMLSLLSKEAPRQKRRLF